MMLTTVTVRFYDSQGKLLEVRKIEADATPSLDVPLGEIPPGAASFTADWPQQTAEAAKDAR